MLRTRKNATRPSVAVVPRQHVHHRFRIRRQYLQCLAQFPEAGGRSRRVGGTDHESAAQVIADRIRCCPGRFENLFGRKTSDFGLQRHRAFAYRLKMSMIWSRGSAPRAVVKDDLPVEAARQSQHIPITIRDRLRHVFRRRNRKMSGENRIRIYQYPITVPPG